MTRRDQVSRTGEAPSATSQWVISTRELGRRPGNMRTYQRTIPASAEFSLGVIGIPENSPVELDVRLESASEGVFVSGTASGELAGECSRCLESIADTVTVSLGELFAYPNSATEATTDADEISRIVDDYIDTEPMVRDAVLLALPLAPLCREDCAGLCPDCGERWADLEAGHGHDTMDTRWAALGGWLDGASDSEASDLQKAADTDVDAAADERR